MNDQVLESGEQIRELIGRKDIGGLLTHLKKFSHADIAWVIANLDEEARVQLLELLSPAEAASILHDVTGDQAADMLETIDVNEAANILGKLPTDEQVDILAEVETKNVEAILMAMPEASAVKAREIMKYPSDVAGGIMSLEYLSYPESMTVGEVLKDLRTHQQEYSDYEVQYAYITSKSGKLKGVLRMRDLIMAKPSVPVTELMIREPQWVLVEDSLDTLVRFFEDHNFIGAPVVDADEHLVGVIRRARVMESTAERAESSFLHVSGIVGGEEFRYMPVLHRSTRRLSWLSINIVLNIMAASVIAFYQETLAAVIALAVFLPIISDMSGCSGNQAVAVSIRELTLGLVRPSEILKVCFKEAAVGIINGLALGILVGLVGYLWKGNLYLGLVIGGALGLNTIIAVCIGGSVPLVLRKIKMDPALASGPILTTITDMCGFFITLSLASIMLARLI